MPNIKPRVKFSGSNKIFSPFQGSAKLGKDIRKRDI